MLERQVGISCCQRLLASGRPAERRRVSEPTAATLGRSAARSEEHTSELQSQSNLVCRLLLEKKKTSATPIGSPRNLSNWVQPLSRSGSRSDFAAGRLFFYSFLFTLRTLFYVNKSTDQFARLV